MNSLTIVGRLTRDPEYTPAKGDKSQYAKYTVAVDNEFGDLTSFFPCVSFGAQADNINKFVRKGRQVAIKGRMEQGDKYTDNDGKERRSWTVRVERIEFLGTKAEMVATDVTATNPNAFPEPAASTATVDDIPDSWEQAEEDNPF